MEPIYDIQGETGLIRVWNATQGYLEVSEEGYLLQGETSAWVEETDGVIALIAEGLLVVVGGQSSPVAESASTSSKKKKSSSATSQSPTDIEDQPAVDESLNKNEAKESTQSNNDVSVETV